jgi:hypothetical protein
MRLILLRALPIAMLGMGIFGCEKQLQKDQAMDKEGLVAAGKGGKSTSSITFSGQATVVQATVLGTTVKLGDTGPLSAEGGAKEASLLEGEIPDVLSAKVLHATTIGQGDRSRTEASVAKLQVTTAGNVITADFLSSRAMAKCTGSNPELTGSSEILNLVVNGQAITVSGAPNQSIALPVGQIIINEQVKEGSGNYGGITVNALHIIIPGVADIIIASSHADISCSSSAICSGNDFVTGGGYNLSPSGGKRTFGVAGGDKKRLWGHLTYIDHDANLKVKGTGVTAYVVVSATTRRIEGTCEINGQPGTYSATVSDNGEPGRNVDEFILQLNGATAAAGKLAGGNIQLHKPCK